MGVMISRHLARNPYVNRPDPDDNVDRNPLPPDDANFFNRHIPRMPYILETGPERRARLQAALLRQQDILERINRRRRNVNNRKQVRRWRT